MISWIQRVLQRHNRWFFSFLLIVIIVAFVFTIGNTGGFGSGNPQDVKRDFYGYNLNSPTDTGALQKWSLVSLQLSGRRVSQSTLEIAMLQRATLLHLADKLQIPSPHNAQFMDFLSHVPAFLSTQDNQFSPNKYTEVLDQFDNSPNLGQELLTTVLNQDYRMGLVMKAISGPGYVLPTMAKEELKRQGTVYSVDMASLNKDTFEPKIDTSLLNLEEFYQQNTFRYKTPEQVQLSYVEFPAKNYVDKVPEPTEAQLQSYYEANIMQWPKQEDGKPSTLAQVKDQVKVDWKHQQALDNAAKAANTLAVRAYDAVYDDQLRPNTESINRFLSDENLVPQTIAAFSPEALPEHDSLSPEALQQAVSSFNRDRFYTDGIISNDNVVIFFLENVTPPHQLKYDQVKAKVLADYKTTERDRLYNLKAVKIKGELEKGVETGKNFDQLAQSLGLEVNSYNDFKVSSPPEGIDYFVLSKLREMHQGDVSDLMSFGTLGTYIYVAKEDIPTDAIGQAQIDSAMERLQAYSAQATAQSTLNELVVLGEINATPHEF